jgi:ribosome biogenesis GTPase
MSRIVRQAAGRRTEPQVVGANLNTVFVVTSLNRDFNPRRLERYLAVVWEGGATPVVVLNKADLCDAVGSRVDEARGVAAGAAIVAISALAGAGVDALDPWLGLGQTIGLVGSSGVGKSTLANALIGDQVQDTGAIRTADDRGRHTTTRRQLLVLPGERGILLDTPGMRELGMWGGEAGLRRAFADVERLAAACRFRDCSHASEPGCAVRVAIDAGTLEPGRVDSFRELLAEAAESIERARVADARRERVTSGRRRRGPRRR